MNYGFGSFLFIRLEEVFVNFYNFNPIMVKHASIYVKNTCTQVKKCKISRWLKKLFGAGAGTGAGAGAIIGTVLCIAAPRSRSRSRKKYFRLHNTRTNSRNPQHGLHLVTFKVLAALAADPHSWS
jgi:hypothetical protein